MYVDDQFVEKTLGLEHYCRRHFFAWLLLIEKATTCSTYSICAHAHTSKVDA